MMIDLIDMLRRNEGVRAKVYLDSLGIPTVGVGFNLKRLDAPSLIEQAGARYNDVLLGKTALTDRQIDQLLQQDVKACLKDLRAFMPAFDQLPDAAQAVLVDMRFQLGAAGLRGFKNTLAAFKDHRWRDAAAGLRGSLAYRQAPVRWERNAKSLENLK